MLAQSFKKNYKYLPHRFSPYRHYGQERAYSDWHLWFFSRREAANISAILNKLGHEILMSVTAA